MAIGAGWQAIVAYVNIVCYYVFGIPIGLLMGYKLDMGVTVSTQFHVITPDRTTWLWQSCNERILIFAGYLDRHVVWDGSTNTCSVLDSIQDQLEQRGKYRIV